MGYSLEFLPDVQDFLFNLPRLSHEDRVRLFDTLDVLRTHGDDYRGDASRRLSPGSEHFSFDLLLLSESGEFRHFRFVVSDASAVYGVLRLVYADEL